MLDDEDVNLINCSFVYMFRPTKRVGGAGDTSLGPPNLFQEKGPHEAFKLILIFTFLGCLFMLFLFLSLSIALNTWVE